MKRVSFFTFYLFHQYCASAWTILLQMVSFYAPSALTSVTKAKKAHRLFVAFKEVRETCFCLSKPFQFFNDIR